MKVRVPNNHKPLKSRLDAPKTKVQKVKRTKLKLKILNLEAKDLDDYWAKH